MNKKINESKLMNTTLNQCRIMNIDINDSELMNIDLSKTTVVNLTLTDQQVKDATIVSETGENFSFKELEQKYSDLQALQETTQKLVEAQDSTIDELRKAVESYANEAERAQILANGLTKSYQSVCEWIREQQFGFRYPVFKVGDEVRLKFIPLSEKIIPIVKIDLLEETTFKIRGIYEDKTASLLKNGKVYVNPENGNTMCFPLEELQKIQHAPKKELKFGDWAEIIEETDEFPQGEAVLICAVAVGREYLCYSESAASQWVNGDNLKPL